MGIKTKFENLADLLLDLKDATGNEGLDIVEQLQSFKLDIPSNLELLRAGQLMKEYEDDD